MDLALRDLGFDPSMIVALHDMFDFMDETTEQKPQHPSRTYIRDTKAMKATPADVIEYPNVYQFLVDMPGLKPDQVKVHLEDENVLVVSGERKREKEKEKEGIKYLKMERRFGKLLKKFVLPENANTDAISAAFQDGVLVVTVEKRPPPEPKKPKAIEVKLGGGECSTTGGGGVQATEGGGQQVKDVVPSEVKTLTKMFVLSK